MSEIEVEAVDSLAPSATGSAEYVLYGGKGGVGKTTMAAATALASATDGTPTLVVSTDPAHSLSDTLEVDVPAEPTRLREDVPLYGVEIDPDAAMEEAAFFGDGSARGPDAEGGANASQGGGPLGGMGGPLGDLLGGENPMSAAGMPGADEAAAMQALLRFMDDERFDRVVVDTAPTGHTLRLLELPEQLDSMVGRLLRFREKMSGMMDSVAGLFGDNDDVPDAGMGDLDELKDRIERLRAVLTDRTRTDFRVVMVPEVMSVRESKRLVARLDQYGIPVGTVVVNRVMEPLTSVADVGPDVFASPDPEGCEFCKRRWEVQQEALADAQDLFRGHDVKRVPLLAEEVRGDRALRLVATCLT